MQNLLRDKKYLEQVSASLGISYIKTMLTKSSFLVIPEHF